MSISKVKINWIIFMLIFLLIVPIIPYKLPSKCINSDYIELGVYCTQTTGGQVVLSGSDEVVKYAEENGYENINCNEVNLVGDNPYKTIKESELITYLKFRVYGEFVNEVDEYNVLSFEIKEWYPLDKYIRLCDTRIWGQYKLIYIVCLIFIAIVIIINKRKIDKVV